MHRRPVLLAVPLLVVAVAAWGHRWMSDDGFINLRVVQQVLAGNGPVFNVGERVEAATSPLWVAVLVVGSFLPGPLEWAAVLLGIGLTLAGLVLAMLAARRLHGPEAWLPAGALVVACLPPFWDYASSGLETGLAFAWLGLCGYRLAGGGRLEWTAVLVALGPLVRPDFAIFTLAFVVVLWVQGGRWKVVALAVAPAVAVELLRMGYYAAAVPNTALAKEASRANWGQGLDYLADFVGPYLLWLPLVLLVLGLRRSPVTVAFVAGGLVHAVYVTRVGGDFMHGRLLLPAVFAVALPAAVVPLKRWPVAAAVAMWALVCAAVLRVDYGPDLVSASGIADERRVYGSNAGAVHPVTLDDYRRSPWAERGLAARAEDERVLLLGYGVPGVPDQRRPLAPDAPAPVVLPAVVIGLTAFAAGPDVIVVDGHGLADPIAGRLELAERGRPGHEKLLDLRWVEGRYGKADVPALACGDLADVLDGVTEPLSVSRMLDNVPLAVRTLGFRVPVSPDSATAELC